MIALEAGDALAQISPKLGGSILSYQTKKGDAVCDWLRSNPDARHPTEAACFVMAPYCSRICDGKFSYAGKSYRVRLSSRLPKTDTDLDAIHRVHALHGSAWINAWDLTAREKNSCSLVYEEKPNPEIPFVFRISQNILLTEEYLSVELTLTNLGDDNMPFGLGLHPYFPIVGDTKIRARVHKMWRTKNYMPAALVKNAYCHQLELESGLSPARTRLDHTFTGWDGTAMISNQNGILIMETETDLPEQLCIFSPNREFFCAEPVSNPANGLNLLHRKDTENGIRILEPRATRRMKVRFKPQSSAQKD